MDEEIKVNGDLIETEEAVEKAEEAAEEAVENGQVKSAAAEGDVMASEVLHAETDPAAEADAVAEPVADTETAPAAEAAADAEAVPAAEAVADAEADPAAGTESYVWGVCVDAECVYDETSTRKYKIYSVI